MEATLKQIQLNPRYLKAALVLAAVKDIRYYLNGVLVDIRPAEVRIVATDGHRLGVFREKHEGGDNPVQVIIPHDVIKAMKPHRDMECVLHYPDADGELECKLSNLAGPDLSFKPVDGKFPDYDRTIPRAVPSLEYSHFNSDYLADFNKAVRTAFDSSKLYAQVWPRGDAAAAVTCGRDEFFGVVMPMRGSGVYDAPDWVGTIKPVPAEERQAA
jgi:DNA polymerase-3 subunit beta